MDTGDSRRVCRQPGCSAAPDESRMRPLGCRSGRSRPATEHTAPRRRPRNRCRVRVGESQRWPRLQVSVIRHALAPRTVGALPVAMVEAALGAALVARPGGPHRPQAAGRAARLRAVGVAAVAGRADREGLAAHAAGSPAERVVHGVGAHRAGSDWTTGRNRVTTAPTGRLCRSAGRSRGSGGRDRALTSRLRSLQQSLGCDVSPGVAHLVRRAPASPGTPPRARRWSPGQSPNTTCADSQGPAYSLLDGGLLCSGQPGVTGSERGCLA